MIFFLTLKSMLSRKFTSFLCVFSIALSVALFLGVERLRHGARDGFTNTLSQTDLIVGARGGPLQLLLYTIFHMGSATNNIRASSLEHFSNHPMVRWVIPISLGDSYKGHRVVGTDARFFEHYRYRGDQTLSFAQGKGFQGIFDVVVGAEVAKNFNLKLGDPLILSHGLSSDALMGHDNTPFQVTGILSSTLTPVDKALYVSLEGMEAMHLGWESGVPDPNKLPDPNELNKDDLQPKQVTSFLLAAKSRIQVLRLRSEISQYTGEPLMAIIPGLVLQELWQTLGHLEKVLLLISFFVLLSGLIGILISLTYSVQQRRREMAILRSLGASMRHLIGLLLLESLTLVILGSLLGLGILFGGLLLARPYLEQEFSVYLPLEGLSLGEVKILGMVLVAGILAGVVPALRAALNSLQDGLTQNN